MSGYFMVVRKREDGAYGVYFPDLPGCVSSGHNQDEVLDNARSVLRRHIETLIEEARPLPAPRSLVQLMADADVSRDFAAGNRFLMSVPLTNAEDAKRRVTVALEPSLITALDKAAEAAGVSRAEILAIAARHYVESQDAARSSVKRQNAA